MSVASGRRPADACRALVELANARGGEDNVSAIVLHVTGVKRARPSVADRFTSFLARCRTALGR
jgi:serine/threonine protein phosphatase PrpC